MSRISAAESQIMQALWARGPQGAENLIRDVGGAQSWGEATVKTLIQRLARKKALVSERQAGRVRYRPLISREDYLTEECQGLLDRLFGGQIAPLVAHYASRGLISAEDLERLKQLIADLETDGQRPRG